MTLLERRLAWQKHLRGRAASAPGSGSGSGSGDEGLLRIGIAATFTANPLAPYLGSGLDAWGIEAAIEVGPFDQIVQSLMDPTVFVEGRPDVLIVWARLEDAWERGVIPLVDGDAEESLGQLLAVCAAARQAAAAGMTVLLVLPATPAMRPLGVGDAQNLHGVAASAARVREAMRAEVFGSPGLLVADAEEVVQELGRKGALDPRRMASASIPYTENAFALCGDRLANLLRIHLRGASKVAVVDADNTLWGGIVGEDGADAIDLADNGPGVSYRGFQRYLRELRRAGMLIALASKNNEPDAWAGFARREMVLRRDDLAAWRVCWDPKSRGIADMADELNLGVSSMTFIDDSGAEIAEVAAALPDVRSHQMPADPAGWFDAIAAVGTLDRLPPTTSDLGRAGSYQQENRRRQARESVTVGQYLQSLHLAVRVFAPSAGDLDRFAQLVAKTNQFVLGGHQPSSAEIAALADDSRAALRLVEARDDFGDYGIVGALIVLSSPDSSAPRTLDTLVLSCRAMGRGVEDAMLCAAVELAGDAESPLSVRVSTTAKNAPLRQWMARLGAQPDVETLIDAPVWPAHIARLQ